MKFETSDSVDLLLHGYALGSRYDGATSMVLAVFLSACMGIGVTILLMHVHGCMSPRTMGFRDHDSAPNTAAIHDMLRKTDGDTESSSYYSSSYYSGSTESDKQHRGVGARTTHSDNCKHKYKQEKPAGISATSSAAPPRVNPLLPSFSPKVSSQGDTPKVL